MKTLWNIFIGLFILVTVLGLGFWLRYLWIVQYGFFAPMQKNVERKVFENTQSYIEWKRQELNKYRLEYITTKDEEVKNAIKMTILQSFSNFDKTKLDYELRIFLNSLYN